jgi:hypothetical protein
MNNTDTLKAKLSAARLGPIKTPPPEKFSPSERELLLLGTIDALEALPDGPAFNVWKPKGASPRIYFPADNSWLAWSAAGVCKYGMTGGDCYTDLKDTIAFDVRKRLGLTKPATRRT